MKVRDIIDRVTTLYNDKDFVRVTRNQYLQFVDDALTQLVLSRPDSHVKTEVVKLVPGTRQLIPADGLSLIDIYVNKIADISPEGEVTFLNGPPVFQVERKDLDYFNDWQSAGVATTTTDTNNGNIKEYAYDTRSPRTFWVSPYVGTNIAAHIEMDYSHSIPAYASMPDQWYAILNKDVPVNEVFRGPIINYVLYLLYSTDSTSANDRVIAQRYEGSFYQGLGLEYNAALIVVPKVDDQAFVGVPGTGATPNG